MSKRVSDILRACLAISLLGAGPGCTPQPEPPPSPPQSAEARPSPLVVYAARSPDRVMPLIEAYRAESGGRVQVVTDAFPALLEKTLRPAAALPADAFLVGSLAELWKAAESGAFRPIPSWPASDATPRDIEMRWIALSMRPRLVAYNPSLVTAPELEAIGGYASLGEPVWKDRLCLSSFAVPGNQSLLAALIRRFGERDAELIVRGWKANTGLPEFVDDAALLDAIAAGDCGLGIADFAEVAHMLSRRPDLSLAPHDFGPDGDLHVDLTGIGITRHAHNPDAALHLVEWLGGAAPNALQASLAAEFPANADAPLGVAVAAWRSFRRAPQAPGEIGFRLEDARLLAERARYR